MSKRAMPVLLFLSVASAPLMAASGPSPVEGGKGSGNPDVWRCFTADDARERQRQVEQGLLPRVAFTGESAPAGIESRMSAHKVPAISVAVVHDGRLDWSASWGRLQHDGARAGCDSLFQAGSLAKPATVLAALRMQEKGVIDLDADVGTTLTSWQLPKGLQTDANPVTLRKLFAHTAGITPGGYDGYAQGQPIPTDRQTVQGEAPGNAGKVEVLAAPGTFLRYSGGGYTVAEIALQDRLKQPFERIMREWLTTPAGMKQADFTQPLPAASHARTARGHLPDGSAVPGGWHNHPEQAAAGLWATASDLAALLIEIRKGWLGQSKVFSQASIRELLAEPFDGHAYGFRLIGEGDELFITHYGGTVGYRAGMTLNLPTGNGAAYLVNSDNGSELGLEFLAAVSGTYDWPTFRQENVQRTALPADVLQSLVGRYRFPDGGPDVLVVYEQQTLAIVFPNGDRYQMTPIVGAPREFIHPATAVRASFDGEGTEAVVHLYGETAPRVADK
jgi:CubicO group peptidase (beta-lactamase class C family)